MKRNPYLLIFLLVLLLTFGYFIDRRFIISQKKSAVAEIKLPDAQNLSLKSNSEEVKPLSTNPINLFNSYLIKNVPFQSQAPFANWDELHDEACEEASVIIVNYFLNDATLSARNMDEEILKMVAWQEKNWGGHYDLTIKQTGELAKNIFGLSVQIKNISSIEDIKKEIVQGYPVIIPTAGRLLGNPNYRQPGPVYHMLVVIGYDGKTIITQDVGTRKGDHYKYNEEILFNAIHDWTGKAENIETGAKKILILN